MTTTTTTNTTTTIMTNDNISTANWNMIVKKLKSSINYSTSENEAYEIISKVFFLYRTGITKFEFCEGLLSFYSKKNVVNSGVKRNVRSYDEHNHSIVIFKQR